MLRVAGSGSGGTGPTANPPQVTHPLEGENVVISFGQLNGSLLLDPVANRNLVNVTMPNPPLDGQIITISSTKNITQITFTPAIPSFPGGMAAVDNYQVKWYAATSSWSLLK